MNGVSYALRRVHSAETVLVRDLLRISDRHPAEHEVRHVARDLAGWSATHLERLSRQARDYGLELAAGYGERGDAEPNSNPIVLLEDIAGLYLRAAEASLSWEMLAQIAQAQRDKELLALTADCHPETLRQIRWANTILKIMSPQALSSM